MPSNPSFRDLGNLPWLPSNPSNNLSFRDLGEGYEEVIEHYPSDKPYRLRRERQIVMRYEAPDFREVVNHSECGDVT